MTSKIQNMTNFVVCIACLGTKVKMVPLINPIHREFFVKLADFKPTLGDTTHDMLCYICFSQLQRCYRFMSMSQKAQGILQQLRCYSPQLSQCTVSPMKEKPTFVISAIKSFDKILSEETVESIPLAQDIKPIIITPMNQIKEELLEITDVQEELEITDVEEEEPITVKEEPTDNDVELSVENHHPHENKSKETENSLLVPLIKKYVKKAKVNNMLMCNDCGKTFTCSYYLERHMRIHTGEKPHTCEVCNRKFAQKSHIKQHMRQHTGERPYTCHICKNKTFNHQSNYNIHMRKHFGEKTHKCELCIAKFHQKSDLQRHIMSHTGEKPFSCDLCDTKFSQKGHLTKHIKDFHPGDKVYECVSTLSDKKMKNSQETFPQKVIKQFTCTYAECFKIFQRKGALFNHINRIHLGVIPNKSFFCVKCKTKFTKQTHLKKHACEFKSPKKIEVCFGHQDLQKNGVKSEYQVKNDEEEYIIP